MSLYGVFFGIWFGIGCYRLFTLIEIDAENEKAGYNVAESLGVTPGMLFLWSWLFSFGWPLIMPYEYFVGGYEDEDEDG